MRPSPSNLTSDTSARPQVATTRVWARNVQLPAWSTSMRITLRMNVVQKIQMTNPIQTSSNTRKAAQRSLSDQLHSDIRRHHHEYTPGERL